MFCLAFTSNGIDRTDPEAELTIIAHETEMMVKPETIAHMTDVWHETFHVSERPIDLRYEDAPASFAKWLVEQPLGYILLKNVGSHSWTVPIYELTEEQQDEIYA